MKPTDAEVQRAAEVLEHWSRPRGDGKKLGISHIPLNEWNELIKLYAQVFAEQRHACRAQQAALVEALEFLLAGHIRLVNSGDCGSWNVECEEEVKKARAALAAGKGKEAP